MIDSNIGKVIGVYTVESLLGKLTNDGHKLYKCVCNECGYVRETTISALNRDARVHLGCKHLTKTGQFNRVCDKKKWISDKKISKAYLGIMERCYNPECRDYRWYGAKGIAVCDEWKNNPKSFEKWCKDNYNGKLCLNRINVNEGYYPENCQWETLPETARNKTTTNYYDDGDEILTGKQLSSKYGLGVNSFNKFFRQNNISEKDVTPDLIHSWKEHVIALLKARKEAGIRNREYSSTPNRTISSDERIIFDKIVMLSKESLKTGLSEDYADIFNQNYNELVAIKQKLDEGIQLTISERYALRRHIKWYNMLQGE